MLPRKHLCRRHHCALTAIGRTHNQRKKCQNRFPRTDIPLNQSAHNRIARKVTLYFFPYPALCIRQPIRKRFEQPHRIRRFYHLTGIWQCVIVLFHPAKHQDKQKKFLKNKPFPRPDKCVFICRKVHLVHGVPVRHKPEIRHNGRRQKLLCGCAACKSLVDRFGHRLITQSFCQYISGKQSSCHFPICLGLINSRLFHDKPVSLFLKQPSENMKNPFF